MDKFNLDDMLSRPVVSQSERPSFVLDENSDIENVNDVQYDQEIVDQNLKQQHESQQREQQQEIEHATEAIDEGFMPHRDMAETIVNLLDGMQSSFLPMLIEKRTFTEKERETLQTMDLSGATEYIGADTKAMLYKKWLYYEKKIKKVPFNTGETKRLINATERYAKTVDLKMTPMQGLLAAYSEVIFNRGKLILTD
jgi:hypothetical protein